MKKEPVGNTQSRSLRLNPTDFTGEWIFTAVRGGWIGEGKMCSLSWTPVSVSFHSGLVPGACQFNLFWVKWVVLHSEVFGMKKCSSAGSDKN